MANQEYVLHMAAINGTALPINQASYNPGIEPMLGYGSGAIDPTLGCIGSMKPVCRFRTTAVKTALDICGIGGLALTSTTKLYFGKTVSGGSFASGSVHTSLTVNEGLLVWRSLSGGQGEFAQVEYELFAVHDGTNYPFTVATNAALPSVTALTQGYRVHSVTIGETVYCVSDINIDTGIDVLVAGDASRADPTMAAIKSCAPVVSFSSPAVSTLLGAVGVGGAAITAFTATFAACVSGGVFGASNHITVGMTGGIIIPKSVDATHNEQASISYEAHAAYDGSNAILDVATDASSLPTVSPLAELYTAGPALLSSPSATLSTSSCGVEFGISLEKGSDSGNYQPTRIWIAKREPELRVGHIDIGVLTIYGAAQANAYVSLRKVEEGATRVAAATEEHIQFKAVVGLAYPGEVSGTGQSTASDEVILKCIKSGENDPITVDTTFALS